MRKLIDAIIKTASGTLTAIVFSVLTTKVIAVFSGPAGTGLFSLLRQTQQTLVGLATLNGDSALVQGSCCREGESKKKYLITIATIFILTSSIISLAVWFGAPLLARLILKQEDVQSVNIIRALIPAVFLGVGLTYLSGVLNSFKALGRLAFIKGFSAVVVSILVYPIIVLIGGSWGLVLLLWITNGAGFLIACFFTYRAEWFSDIFKNWRIFWEHESASYFLKFAGTSVIGGLTGTGTILVIRTLFVRHGGLVEAGIFDMAWTLSTYYLMILLGSMGTYYLPALSSTNFEEERLTLILQVFRVMIMLGVPLIVFVIITKPLVISLLYSDKFLPSLEIVQWMLIGDYFKIVSWSFSMTMLAYADMKTFLYSEVAWYAAMLIGAWLSLFVYNKIWMVGFIFCMLYVFYFIFCYIYVVKKHSLLLPRRETLLLTLGLLIIISASIVTWGDLGVEWVKVLLLILILLSFLWWSLKKEERNKLFFYLAKKEKQ